MQEFEESYTSLALLPHDPGLGFRVVRIGGFRFGIVALIGEAAELKDLRL